MKKARIIGSETLVYSGICFHIETMNHAHMDWMNRNGLEKTKTVETETGKKFVIWSNWARRLACAIPV